MKYKHLNIFYILFILTVFGCKNSNDNKIIVNKYVSDLTNVRNSIFENSDWNPKTDSILPILDTIIHEIEKTETVSKKIKEKIYSNITNLKNDKLYEPPKPYDDLILCKENFLNGNMSKIETLDFIEKFFLFNYWINWSCNYSFHKLVSLVKLDTLYLKAMTEYELPIQMQYNEIPSIRILSNTIQGYKPNRIKFKTDKLSNRINIIPFEVKAINDVTKEISNFKDTIKYITIKND